MVLLEMDGTDGEVEETVQAAADILGRKAMTLEVSRDEARRCICGRPAKRHSQHGDEQPRHSGTGRDRAASGFGTALREISLLAEKTGFRVWNAYHAGDGSIHLIIVRCR